LTDKLEGEELFFTRRREVLKNPVLNPSRFRVT
jgi:hypothetical protein